MSRFDPYHKWLGIRPEEHPVNHYRLLGVTLFEDDLDTISCAADQRMGHVRSYQTGTHAAWSQRILNELAAARVCLLHPEKKAAYDQSLRRIVPPPPPSAEPPIVVQQDGIPDLEFATTYKKLKKRSASWMSLSLAGIGGFAAIVLVAIFVATRQQEQGIEAVISQHAELVPAKEEPEKKAESSDGKSQVVKERALKPLDPPKVEAKLRPKPIAPKLTLLEDPSPLPEVEPLDLKPASKSDGVASSASEASRVEVHLQKRAELEPKSSSAAASRTKSPIPDETAQQKSLAAIRVVYKEEYKKLDKASLVTKLIQKAKETQNATDRFVLLQEAKDVASETWQGELAFEAIDAMAREFDLHGLEMKADVVEQAAKKSRNSPEQKTAIVKATLPLIEEAVGNDNFNVAKRLATHASQLVRFSKDKDLIQEVAAKNKEIRLAAREYADAKDAIALLNEKPDDPDANSIVGKYECFHKDNWRKGLPMLVKGSDEKLRKLAEREVAGVGPAKEKMELGDAWAEVSKERANYWYKQALPGLSGLERDKVDRKINAAEPSKNQERLSSQLKIEVIAASTFSPEMLKKAFRTPIWVKPTSFFDRGFRPEFAIDGKMETEFAFKGSVGKVDFDFGRGIRCSAIVFRSRNSQSDTMELGSVAVNYRDAVPFSNFGGGNLLIVKSTGPVRTITIESIRGRNNPGIAETCVIR